MKFYDYIQETGKTWSSQSSNFNRVHIDLGLFSSFGKLCGEIQKVFQYKEIDKNVILEASGELCYYLARWTVEHMKMEEVRGYKFESFITPDDGTTYIGGINKQIQKLVETREGECLRVCILDIAHLLKNYGYTLHDCLIANLIKLTEKYPEKFTKSYINILKGKK